MILPTTATSIRTTGACGTSETSYEPRTSVAWSTRLMARAFDLDFDAFRRQMETGFAECLASPEHRAAMDELRHRRRG